MEVLERARHKKRVAEGILDELELLQKWSKVGVPHLVGAAAYDLIVSPDIDIETFCADPRPDEAMALFSELAGHPNVIEIKYRNYLDSPFNGLYFKLLYNSDDTIWNIDMWMFASSRKGVLSRDLVADMTHSLTKETRALILLIKEDLIERTVTYPSIFIYQAVIDGHVRSVSEFQTWIQHQDTARLTTWRPSNRASLTQ